MNREKVTKELKEFEKVLGEYEAELKEMDKEILELEGKKKLQEKANDENILVDREKVNIDKVIKLGAEVTSLKEYRNVYIKAMNKKLNEKAIATIREYNDKARGYMADLSTGNRKALEELEERYKEEKEALEGQSRRLEAEERNRVVNPRIKAIDYLDEEQEKEARLLRLGY